MLKYFSGSWQPTKIKHKKVGCRQIFVHLIFMHLIFMVRLHHENILKANISQITVHTYTQAEMILMEDIMISFLFLYSLTRPSTVTKFPRETCGSTLVGCWWYSLHHVHLMAPVPSSTVSKKAASSYKTAHNGMRKGKHATFVDSELLFLVNHRQISHYANVSDRVVANSVHTCMCVCVCVLCVQYIAISRQKFTLK